MPVSTADVLRTPLQYLKGVGPRRAADLRAAGLDTVEDLLCRFPLRYEDRGRFRPIASLSPGEPVSIAGEVVSCGVRTTRRPGFRIFEMLVRDPSGVIRAVWFNQAFLLDVFERAQHVVLYGPVERRGSGGLQIANPQYEVLRGGARDVPDDEGAETEAESAIHTGRLVPIYEKTGTLTTRMQRRLVHAALQRLPADLDDPLPGSVIERRGLMDRRRAFSEVHFPAAGTPLAELNAFRTPAQVRLIFEEFFLFQAGLLLRRHDADAELKPRVVTVDDRLRESARRVLPFRLTAGQKAALREIVDDMRQPRPMNRLLQGDVGAGKTIVALLAALVAMENDFQVAFMAPTEILAEQHFLTLRRLLERSRFHVSLLTGATPQAARRDIGAALASGATHLVVGTHALVQDPVSFRDLGLVVIDEQHRFGVVQRAALRQKGLRPDVLVMTATPIPRTLALTTYGDLDLSVIRDRPPGRRPVRTLVEPESKRPDAYDLVRRELDRGRQAYVVYPLVEESAKLDLRAATEMADHLAQEVFPQYRVGLLHGRLKQDVKDRVMASFARGGLDVLVSTTVVEVGVDVPNASVMVIEHAERFGLAQLHQLRGRVGRDAHQSYCLLLYQGPLSDQGRRRLGTLAESDDGFLIAERDLELRGPGDFFGTRQSGMPTLRVGDLLRDHALMEQAREDAVAWMKAGAGDTALLDFARREWSQRFGLVGVG